MLKLKLLAITKKTKHFFSVLIASLKGFVKKISGCVVVKDFVDFFKLVVVYGIMLNIVFAGLFSFKIGLLELFSFGLAYYFLRFEFVAFISNVAKAVR